MKRSEWLTIIGMVAAGWAATIGVAVSISGKIGGIEEKITSMEKTLNQHTEELKEIRGDITEIRGDIGEIRGDIREMKGKVDILWQYHLDHAYTRSAPSGAKLKAMQTSEVTGFAAQHYGEIVSKIKSFKPQSARQVEQLLVSIVSRYSASDEYRLALEDTKRATGYDIDSLLYAAAWSIRDKVVHDLGF